MSREENGVTEDGLKVLIYRKTYNEEISAAILKQLLDRLTNDGYIMMNEVEKRYIFRAPPLRDFWYNKIYLN